MDIIDLLASELGIKKTQVTETIKLIDDGNTIPFIARYRKEATGSLNDEILREFDTKLKYYRNLEEKREMILATIKEQEKLTPDLQKSIENAMTMVELEDLYRPYRPKKRTRATIAKEKGLDKLAQIILLREETKPMTEVALNFVDEAKGVDNVQDALSGAKDIIAEMVSDDASYRKYIRRELLISGKIVAKAKDDSVESVYEGYYDYSERVKDIVGHRILALNRGEKEKILTVKIEADDEAIVKNIINKILSDKTNENTDIYIKEAVEDAYKRLIFPSVERVVRNELTEYAQDGAMEVFKKNLNQLLMQPPIVGKTVLGWDPAFRTGCKLAVVDETGNVLDTRVIYPTEPQNKVKEAKEVLKEMVLKYGVNLISLGNGTASRESEKIISEFIKENKFKLQYVVVNEAGASVYSASKLATEEFPNFDVGQRSATSIARRLQDPLSELVKIDPKSIGVGQYQHDMNQKKLDEILEGVVEDCVNRVGVDLNTASASLLENVSGISKTVSKNIVKYRNENGKFNTRKNLLKVEKLGPKMFEQCAGFLRIDNGKEPLDATAVHPENYKVAYEILEKLGYTKKELSAGEMKGISKKILDYSDFAKNLGVGEITLKDIVSELEKPSRDPREDMMLPILRDDVLELSDLKEGMVLKGTVRNVIDFGAFVDIGVHEDGLVHISQLSKKFVKHPLDVVSVGDIVEVKVLSVDINKKRISLTML